MKAVRKNMYNIPKSLEIPSEDNYEAIHKWNNDIVMMESTYINSSTTDTMLLDTGYWKWRVTESHETNYMGETFFRICN